MTGRKRDGTSSISLGVRGFARLIAVFLLTASLSSCLFPEKFTAEIEVFKNGTFKFVYDGILTFVMAKAHEVETGKLSPEDESDLRELEKELKKDPCFKKAEYIGHAQYKVLYERNEPLNAPFYFPGSDTKLISIIPQNDNTVEVTGVKLSQDDFKMLQDLRMTIDGTIKVNTDGTPKSHNAKLTPSLMGLIGSYTWTMSSISDPAPYMLIDLKAQTTAETTGTPAGSQTQSAGKPVGSIREVDFKNFIFQLSRTAQKNLEVGRSLKLSNGEFGNGNVFFKVEKQLYGDLTGDGKDEAVVIATWGLEGANWFGTDVYIFAFDDKPIQLAVIEEDDTERDFHKLFPAGSGNEGNVWATIDNGVTVEDRMLKIQRYVDGPHCCPENIASMRYRWDGKKFILSGKPEKRKFQSQ